MPQAAQSHPTKRSTRVPTRTKQLRDIHQIARSKGYETREGKPGRELYENELMICIGKRSAKKASRGERVAALAHFKALKPLEVAPYSAAELERIVNAESVEDLLGW